MKLILYTGVILMTGAVIYGFADYKKASHKKEFRNMYEVKEVKETISAISKPEELNLMQQPVNNAGEKKELKTPPPAIAKPDDGKASAKHHVTKKKKLSYKFFSRGALEERYINEYSDTLGKTPAKPGNKEQ